ncbi:hypothetical protein DFJ63DRAFT_310151 [Scheffersomyces coipomensis]|uniref:uncharacterized protein n=1 Tax=Scheffersomyces coipomensis TaxID=1788519 RepID=UPI00315C8C30
MKLSYLISVASLLAVSEVNGFVLPQLFLKHWGQSDPESSIAAAASSSSLLQIDQLSIYSPTASASPSLIAEITQPTPTPEPTQYLEKRRKDVIVNKEYAAEQAKKANKDGKSDAPKAWIRTISSTKVEIVTPTVVAGVTFNAQPPKTTNGLEPWISIQKNGLPKTIKPQMKNGNIKNPSPTYGHWFATATTVVYTKEELQAHNMAEGEVFEHEIYIEEDKTEHELNPMLRCTPDFYFKKGVAKDKSSEPFCFPRDGEQLKMDQTYFISWFSRFFDDDQIQNVKVHLSYVKETVRQKGLKKRDDEFDENIDLSKRSALIDQGAKVDETSFFQSEWIPKTQGYFPLTIKEEWIGDNDYYRKVLVSIQPDVVEENEFNHLANSIVIEIAKGSRVSKGHYTDLKKLEEKLADPNYEVVDGVDFEKYYVMMTMPTMVAVFALGMYLFVWYNKVDLSHLKKRTFARENFKHRLVPLRGKHKEYAPLPQYNSNNINKTD